MKTLFASIMLLIASTVGFCQQASTHVPWTKEDSAAINALVLYPDSVRLQIFQACEYPAIIVNVASLQKNTSTAFANAISGYSREEQEDIWNLSRYPGLIDKLANNTSDDQLNATLADYPNDIHDVATKYGKNYQGLLKTVDSIQNSANTQFDQYISYYPADVQQTFRNLLQYPEILSLLNEHLSLAVRVGDHYKRDPQRVIHKADSNAVVQARLHTQEVQQWKQTIQSDTAAQNELKQAANEYADSNGYQPNEVERPVDSNEVNNYSTYPYNYWFGYPTWYPYAYWYPYPYWYDWGFYYGPYGNLIVFNTPSFYFTNWYFYYPRHWHYYPHLGNAYITHYYYGPRRVYTQNSMVVRQWVSNNRTYLPNNFAGSQTARVETIREVGQLHEAVRQTGRVENPAARNEYFQNNTNKYPTLNSRPQQTSIPEEREIPHVIQQPQRQPVVVPRPQKNTNTQPRYTPTRNYNNINRAQSYHSNVWESTQPTYHAPAPQYSAPARSYSAPARSGGGGRR
jgi:hypothetical protein